VGNTDPGHKPTLLEVATKALMNIHSAIGHADHIDHSLYGPRPVSAIVGQNISSSTPSLEEVLQDIQSGSAELHDQLVRINKGLVPDA
jgi:hypothetical protein